MAKIFKGRPVLPGSLQGEAIVSRQGLNILAAFQKSVLKKSDKLICADQNNEDLYNKELTGKILCLPQAIGSTTGGMVLETVAQTGIGPKALLFANHIDSLSAAGVILSDVWLDRRIVTVDQLGEEFLEYVQEGQSIEIKANGTIIVD
mgnify:CR=1 FL=1